MSYKSLLYHVVLRTYRSQRTLTETYERDLYHFLFDYMSRQGAQVYRIGGMPDHLHILVSIPPSIAISNFVGEMKRQSAIYMKSERHKFPYFEAWSKSYGVFSYCQRDKEKIKNYIMNQKEHHKRVSLEDELRQLFAEENIPIDERYFLKD